jgi:Ca2+-dependent lipid-binding protein
MPNQPPIGFLNDIIKPLWPHIQVAGSQMIKEVVEPMFKTMLPGPLATLHFSQIDFGATPITVSKVKVRNTSHDGIELNLNVDWVGQCDFRLKGDMIPEVVSFTTRGL